MTTIGDRARAGQSRPGGISRDLQQTSTSPQASARTMDVMTHTDPSPADTAPTAGRGARRGPLRTVWTAISAATGVVVGVAPHVLHHVGPLVGTALIAGTGGTVLFGALGLLAAIPMLVKLRRRFHSWWAPAVALAVFVVAFVVSTTVIGPLIRGDDPSTPSPGQSEVPAGHDQHH